MGKNLIIKGADFSANAVAHETLEPTVYTLVAGIGSNDYTSYNEGDVYYRCNGALSANACGLWKRVANDKERPNLAINSVVKINNLYYKVATEGNIYISPDYGLNKLTLSFVAGVGYLYVDEDTAPTQVSGDIRSITTNLTASKKYVIYGVGGTTFNVAIVKHSNGKYEELTPKQAGVKLIEYTALEGDTLYFSHATTSGNTQFIAEVVI